MDNPVCKDYAIQHPGPKHTSYEYGTVPVRGLYEYGTSVLVPCFSVAQLATCNRTSKLTAPVLLSRRAGR